MEFQSLADLPDLQDFEVFGSLIRCFAANICTSTVEFGINATRQIYYYLVRSFSRMHGCRGCLGCCSKSTPIIAVGEPSKGLRIQEQTVMKPSISEDFWSTSTREKDNSAVQSQRSISSISTSNQTLNYHSGTGSSSNPSEFVNHGNYGGLLLWNQTRQQWIGNRWSENRSQQIREPRLSWNATYDSFLGTNKAFPQPIPLSEMVDFLVDIWELGMYD
ncbi:hypothetical protein HHK36_006058 [Tetracentron sinense]|uniref:Gag1-like clamp domain-containing protein n=1 Tax=Tetracentron sinense TaxID=13715 RepID=A0A835DNR3_TETSI|nr:hypothetical protein HHK36_006058 [Tetracentron sinense]